MRVTGVQVTQKQLPPQGPTFGRCYQIIDLGIQQSKFGSQHKILFSWELPLHLIHEPDNPEFHGRPLALHEEYSFTIGTGSNLAKLFSMWNGIVMTEELIKEGIDIESYLGAPAVVNVLHRPGSGDKSHIVYANMGSIEPMNGRQECPPMNRPVMLDLDKYDAQLFSNLPDWIQKKVNLKGIKAQNTQNYGQNQQSSSYGQNQGYSQPSNHGPARSTMHNNSQVDKPIPPGQAGQYSSQEKDYNTEANASGRAMSGHTPDRTPSTQTNYLPDDNRYPPGAGDFDRDQDDIPGF